eukprot:1430827-Alexandrium_andersonii.AAC.1
MIQHACASDQGHFMRQCVDELRQERLQQLAPVRLLRRLPAHGLQPPEGALQVPLQHGEDKEVFPPLQGSQGA